MAVVEKVISRLFEEKGAAKVSDIGYPRNIPKYILYTQSIMLLSKTNITCVS